MRKLLAATATAMAAVAGLAFAAPAQAAPSDTVSVQDINCHAKESVRIRQSKSTSSTALGLFPKGAGADCGGASEGAPTPPAATPTDTSGSRSTTRASRAT